jgi:hypothetical protein
MNRDDKDFWEQYYSRGKEWFSELPPSFVQDIVEVTADLELPEQAAKLLGKGGAAFRELFTFLAPAVLGQTKNYIENPDQCTPSSWTYHTVKYANTIDAGYWDDALRGFESAKEVQARIHSTAQEFDHPKDCFSFRKQLDMLPETVIAGLPRISQLVKQRLEQRDREVPVPED